MRYLLFLVILCPFLSSCQQAHNTTPPFTVGDRVPDIASSNIINYTSASFHLSSYSNKLLLLDFFSTTCKSCLQKLPELDSLQQQYAPRVQIVLVTEQDKKTVEDFISNSKLGKRIHLPLITNDSVLKSWFPHQFISHVVWINEGTVTAITSSQYVDENNIEIMLMDRTVSWPIKKDVTEYDYSKPLLSLNPSNALEESHPSTVYYTGFTGWLDGVPYRYVNTIDTTASTQRIAMINMPIIPMYLKALGLPVDYPTANMVLNTSDTSRLVYNPNTSYKLSWQQRNCFCYEALLPLSMNKNAVTKKILADLDNYLGLHPSLQKQKTECWVLTGHANKNALPLLPANDKERSLISIADLVTTLSHNHYAHPVINESTLSGFIPYQKEWLTDFNALQTHLAKYGLHLEKQQREVEVLLFTNKP